MPTHFGNSLANSYLFHGQKTAEKCNHSEPSVDLCASFVSINSDGVHDERWLKKSQSATLFVPMTAGTGCAMKRVETYDEIKPLAALCKAGRLFEVQQWIAAGKPVNLPLSSDSRHRRKSPLEVSMDCGFHSLVRVLLESGAAIEEPGYRPLEHALLKRRLDLVALLVDHGVDMHSVSMESVFDTWLPEIMEYFIERGADVETGHPMAGALCNRTRKPLPCPLPKPHHSP